MKKKNIFYGVIGVLTLIVSVVGATYAYFTATANNTDAIKGDMATIDFDVTVEKVTNVDDQTVTGTELKRGLIPMSNNMMEQALTKNAATKGVCMDDNSNAVCQVYKITVINTSSASMFVDGYVTLENGSGTPADLPTAGTQDAPAGYTTVNNTTMRWSQAFCSAENGDGIVTNCTTAGSTTVRASNANNISWEALGGTSTQAYGKNQAEMKFQRASIVNDQTNTNAAVIQGNKYEVINKNYIRVSNHAAADPTYTRAEDTTSALVYNQYLEANDNNPDNNDGTSSSALKDIQVFYIVVWLSETGSNQNANTAGTNGVAKSATDFFKGTVKFISAQGSEVTATFNGLTKVPSNT